MPADGHAGITQFHIEETDDGLDHELTIHFGSRNRCILVLTPRALRTLHATVDKAVRDMETLPPPPPRSTPSRPPRVEREEKQPE